MRRHKILFVDDEELVRESFSVLMDWASSRFDVVGICKNGEAAWDYLKENPVDILVSDINMPFMDGIALLENIRREKLSTRAIFLTGYEFFEYAQKAVQLQAFDFILKPVTKAKLIAAIERAAGDIECAEAVREAVNKGLDLVRRSFVKKVLYGKATDIRAEAQQLGIYSGPGSYLLLAAAVDISRRQDSMGEESETWKAWFENQAQSCKPDLEIAFDFHFDAYFTDVPGGNKWVAFVSPERQCFSRNFIERFVQHFLPFQNIYKDYRITFIAGCCKGSMDELHESYRMIKHATEHRHALPGGDWKLIYAADYSQRPQDTLAEIKLPTDTLLHHVRNGMVDAVEYDIRQVFASFREGKYISLSSAKIITTELAITASKGAAATAEESASPLFYLNHIQHLNTLEDLENDVIQFAAGIAKVRKENSNQKKKIAEGALEFLRKNYAEDDLSLSDVAAAMNISIPYLAVLFKQETGQTFSTHLLAMRMEKAKELLKTTSCSIAEIAEMVGYNSAQYFAVRFKKYTGLTPGAFR